MRQLLSLRDKSKKKLYLFCLHIGINFQKSALSTLFSFSRARAAHQPHVPILRLEKNSLSVLFRFWVILDRFIYKQQIQVVKKRMTMPPQFATFIQFALIFLEIYNYEEVKPNKNKIFGVLWECSVDKIKSLRYHFGSKYQ